MSVPILATKLYLPLLRTGVVPRPHLIQRLNEGLASGHKLTLITAPAGFGKTTLVGEWIGACGCPVAWLSLDEADNDPARFLLYLVAALQTVKAGIGEGLLAALQSPQPPSIEPILTLLLNEIAAFQGPFVLVLDDYHEIDARSVDQALTFLLEHLPLQMRLVITTREDPHLPLARLRASGQLTELRAADLRFTPAEAAEFLNRVMGLNLSQEDIDALEARTEGWIAGLQLAALSMRGHQDASGFIKSFTGSHRFVLDYLVEEVLGHQPEKVQSFLLRTSILDRMCGPLCEAVLLDPAGSGQETLEYLERANLFVVLLDNERRWYRYHRLFGDLLRQRLGQKLSALEVAEYHRRASRWYEDHDLAVEAFQHAAAANDIDRAERLLESKGMPLHFRGVATMVLDWLASLPAGVLDARPSLWVRFAGLTLNVGQSSGVEEKLQAAEAAIAAALRGSEPDPKTHDLIGQIAATRAILALSQYQVEAIVAQSRRALEYLAPGNLPSRFTAHWAMGMAHFFRGERSSARQALTDALSIAQASGNIHDAILATISLGQIQELDNQLYLAAETYHQALRLIGDSPLPTAGEVYRGLAQISYEWNDLDAAERYGQQGLRLSKQYERGIDRFIITEVFLARLKLAQGDVTGAAGMLAQIEQTARDKNFVLRLPEIASAQVRVLLKQGNIPAAGELAWRFNLPLCRVRVLLARKEIPAAMEILEPYRGQMQARGWADELLRATVLQALAYQAGGEIEKAVSLLGDALMMAQPGGMIRVFVDEGAPMVELLREAAARRVMPGDVGRLISACEAENRSSTERLPSPPVQPLTEPLSARELEILRLIALGLTNREIGERLFLALDTIKGHNRIIFDKLQVQSRTKAVARARELGLL